jgi:HD-GYP domain-containing protein (c-di-GMP phosphodiesterase class II)
VEYAADILGDVEFDLPVAESVLQINEALDGSGYPRGLAGDQISMPARILAVANAFCAMVKPRVYRPSMPMEKALANLAEAATKYDPAVVRALRKVATSAAGEKLLGR